MTTLQISCIALVAFLHAYFLVLEAFKDSEKFESQRING
jgi:uncharacterized membrane protein